MWMSEGQKPFCKPWGEVEDDEPISLLNNGFASSCLRRPARYVARGEQQAKKKKEKRVTLSTHTLCTCAQGRPPKQSTQETQS